MKRLLALLLCLVMCVTMIPAAYAGDIEIVDLETEPEAEPIPFDEDLIDVIDPTTAEIQAAKPSITASPKSKTAYVGTTVKFTVKADGAETYQWYYRKSAEGSWVKTTLTGAKTATLSVKASVERNGYQYYCKVSNSTGTSYSKAATLTVSEKPVITTQPASKTVSAGTTVKFTVKADGAETYQWYYRKSAEESWVKTTLTGAKTAALSVKATEARNGYQYRCVLKNAKGTTYSKTATLTVTAAKPSFTTQPLSYTAGAGTTVYLKAAATGAETYQWQYRTSSSGTWYNSSATGNKTATLTVKATEAKNGYQFRCKAFNDAGTGYSKAATLTVSAEQCGDKLTWKLDGNGLLFIGGTGDMYDYTYQGPAPWYSFSDQIKRVSIGNSVTGIGNYAFFYCDLMTSASIGSGVKRIGAASFWYCNSLTEVTIPAAVTDLHPSAFSYCFSLSAINVDSANPNYCSGSGVLYNKDKTRLLRFPAGKAGACTIPATVTAIEDGAFRFCALLTSVSIPAALADLGRYPFYDCAALTKITVDSDNPNYSSRYGVLYNKDKTRLIQFPGGKAGACTIPATVTAIEDGAFEDCALLTSVSIPAALTDFGYYAFNGCAALTKITVNSENPNYSSLDGVLYNKDKTLLIVCPAGKTGACVIPNSVTDIENYAFYGCAALTDLTIGSGLDYISPSDFEGCSSLQNITVSADSEYLSSVDGVLFNKGKTSLAWYPCGRSGAYTVPEGVEYIGYQAFCHCLGLTAVTLPDGVTMIGDSAFLGCRNLAEVTLPLTLSRIESNAFYGCSGLRDVHFEGSQIFWGRISIMDGNEPLLNADIHFPSTVQIIASGSCGAELSWELNSDGLLTISGTGSMANYNQHGAPWDEYSYAIFSVSIGGGVTSIGDHAFQGCSQLTKLSIPGTVERIGEGSFCFCRGMTELTLNEGLTRINESAFMDCSGLTSLTIPGSVTSVGESVFFDCDGLTSVTFLEGVPVVGESMFYGCDKLASVTLPDSVTSIRKLAFQECVSLKTVSLGNGLKSIGGWAFNRCTSLSSVTIPASVTSIEGSSFNYCTSLTAFTVNSANQNYTAKNGVLFNKDKTILIACPGGKTGAYTVPDTVTEVGYKAFQGCDKLTAVVLPEGLTNIGNYSFIDCVSLSSLNIPGTVTYIGQNVFIDCDSLTSIDIPDSVTRLGEYAFEDCDSLTTVTIGSGLSDMGSSVFRGCFSLRSITVAAGNENYSSEDGVLFNKDKTRLLQYPCAKTGDYVIPDTVTSIGSAFSDCRGLTAVTIPAAVSSISTYAPFEDCSSLLSITVSADNECYSSVDGVLFNKDKTELLQYPGGRAGAYVVPDGVTELNAAFAHCSVLTAVTIPEGVTTLSNFQRCSSLKEITIPVSVTRIENSAFYECTSLTDVYYRGSQSQWSQISIYSGNELLRNATMHYNA